MYLLRATGCENYNFVLNFIFTLILITSSFERITSRIPRNMKHNFKARTRKILKYDNELRQKRGGLLCGIDEAGRGPLAGPVVAAAVIFSDDVIIEGVFDSKMLTHQKREELYEEITGSAFSYGIGIIDNNIIDGINILEATKTAMTNAVARLKQEPNLIIVDGNFYSHPLHTVENLIGGDALSFSIAAASIIAKVTRDRMMVEYERMYPHYSFSHHKGYATKKHIEEISEHGLSEIHRRSFKIRELDYEPRQAG
jgi:ribonuclease HII